MDRLTPKGKALTPHQILTELSAQAEQIDEIYVVIKDKAGNSCEFMSGDVGGLAMAILVLQQVALKAL